MRGSVLILIAAMTMAASGCTRIPDPAPMQLSAGGQRLAKPIATWRDMRSRNVVMQVYDYSCGAAAIATLMTHYFGDPVTERAVLSDMVAQLGPEELRERQREGFSLLDLQHFAQRRGYQAVGVRLDLAALPQLRGPVLVFLELPETRHFAILRGVREDRVFLADPSRGNLRMPLRLFAEEWQSGIALVLGREGFGTPVEHALAVATDGPLRPELEAARQGLYRGF